MTFLLFSYNYPAASLPPPERAFCLFNQLCLVAVLLWAQSHQSIHIGTEERKENASEKTEDSLWKAGGWARGMISLHYNPTQFCGSITCRILNCTQVVKDMVWNQWRGLYTGLLPMLQGIVNTIPIISGAKEFFMSGSLIILLWTLPRSGQCCCCLVTKLQPHGL